MIPLLCLVATRVWAGPPVTPRSPAAATPARDAVAVARVEVERERAAEGVEALAEGDMRGAIGALPLRAQPGARVHFHHETHVSTEAVYLDGVPIEQSGQASVRWSVRSVDANGRVFEAAGGGPVALGAPASP